MIVFLNLLDTDDEKSKFILFYEKYVNMVMWLSLRKLNNRALAEESTQECFFYFANNFHKIDDIESLRTKHFVATVAEAFAISIYRAENKNPSELIPEDCFLAEENNILDSINEMELKTAINKLPDESRNMLYLKYVYGYRSKEIAEMLGVSDDIIRKRIQLAKKKVRLIIESEEEDA